ncbi:putative RTA1 domain protein [Talaromyces proteolyticus]|uniref:RTA1 domain protein n=1 Tax=Talaromyces proteolyticus TaxID=1131652 RepID=A0AAD4KZD2_9EURO|nr:putative RTA1 domain protein [Talaromyces proteolyticus]KAH8699306.1 putative RTA1 domain protein [Talaromyces proteolyticus]
MSESTEYQQIKLALRDAKCAAYVEGFKPPYNYVPSLGAGVAFCVLFGLSLAIHTAQFSWKRKWSYVLFSIGTLVEILGWAARTWSAHCPYKMTPFLMQTSTLILAPTFFTAGIYIILGEFIRLLGRKSSILSPTLYLCIFSTCDVISLVIQAVGGGMASSATNKINGNTKPGTNLMVGGIVFQMASITVFVIFAIDFLVRVIRLDLLRTLQGSVLPLFSATAFSVLCIYVRSIYRTIELLQGWSGPIISTERYFIVLDGCMMILAVAIFNVFHPAWFLPHRKEVDLTNGEADKADTVRVYMSEAKTA